MKKRITAIVVMAIVVVVACGCGSENEVEAPNMETEITQEKTTSVESIPEKELTQSPDDQEKSFSFKDIENHPFYFTSGAGGWMTSLTISEDGSFSGEFFDGELGLTGENYPNGTMYQCTFNGQFTQPVKVNDYTYSMQISELNYAEEVGKEEIKDGMLYIYIDIYGLDGAEDILIYLPGAPLAKLPEEFRSWVGYYNLSDTTDTELPFYALNNEAQQYGFYSDIITETNEEDSSGSIPELKSLMFGDMGNLELGTLAYTIPDKDDEDYKLYFFQSENEEDRYLSFEEMNYSLSEAAYVFPDVREGNIPIGRFKEIYFMDMGDIFRKGTGNVIIIATYEVDGTEYYDTRVYEAGESGYVVDTALTQELNEKYYNVKDYPVHEVVALPDDSQN